jgi:hypothetical protein
MGGTRQPVGSGLYTVGGGLELSGQPSGLYRPNVCFSFCERSCPVDTCPRNIRWMGVLESYNAVREKSESVRSDDFCISSMSRHQI